MEGLRHTTVVFDVIGGPPGTCDGPLIAPKVDTDGEIVLRGCLVHFPVFSVSKRVSRPREQQDLNKRWIGTAAMDLLSREVSVLIRNDDRCPQTRIGFNPVGDLPIVDGTGKCGTEFKIQLFTHRHEWVQHTVLNVKCVQKLFLHER